MNKILKSLLIILCLLISSVAFAANGDILAVRISNAANGNGWVAEIDIENLAAGGTYNFGMNTSNSDPTNAKVVFSVTSKGYNTSGNTTTISRTIYGVPNTSLGAIRKPFPNNASPDESVVSTTLTVKVALSDFIYSSDTVTVSIGAGFYTNGTASNSVTDLAVTNNSTLNYPSSVGRWAWVPYEQVQTSSYVVEACIFNRFARNGKQVAAVIFTATDEHSNSVSYTVTDMTVSTRNASSTNTNKVLVYAATIDLTTLTAGDKITVNFVAYPWVGDSGSLLDSSTNADPDERLTPFVFYNDKESSMPGGAVVIDPVNGTTWTSGHAYVYATPAAAEAAYNADNTKSYTKIAGGICALKDNNGTDVSGATVLLIAGNHDATGRALPSVSAMQKSWVTIKPISTITDNTSVVINANAVPSFMVANIKYHWQNITINTSSIYVIGASGAKSAHLWVDGINYVTAGTGPHYAMRYSYATNCNVASDYAFSDGFSAASVIQAWRLIRGNTALHATTSVGKSAQPYCVIGNSGFAPAQSQVDTGNATGLQINDNGIWAFNSHTDMGVISAAAMGFTKKTEYTIGYAIVQNLVACEIENQPALFIYGDGTTANSNNIIIHNNTIIGNRVNWGYNDGTTTGTEDGSYLHKNWSVIGNIAYKVNTKADDFKGGITKTQTNITKSANAVVTAASHGYAVGNKLYMQGITDPDYTFMNGNTYTISAKDTNTYTINADTSAAAADCTSGCGTSTLGNPARVGCWPVLYKVGWYGNVFKTDSGSGIWFGNSTGMYSTPYNTATFSFVHDSTDSTGDSSGTGGVYKNNSNSTAYNWIPSGKNVLPFDLDGNRRRIEADDAGCYVRGLKVY